MTAFPFSQPSHTFDDVVNASEALICNCYTLSLEIENGIRMELYASFIGKQCTFLHPLPEPDPEPEPCPEPEGIPFMLTLALTRLQCADDNEKMMRTRATKARVTIVLCFSWISVNRMFVD